jgi:hypothetical protein
MEFTNSINEERSLGRPPFFTFGKFLVQILAMSVFLTGDLFIPDKCWTFTKGFSLFLSHSLFLIPPTPNHTVITLSVSHCPWLQTALFANLILYFQTSQWHGWHPCFIFGWCGFQISTQRPTIHTEVFHGFCRLSREVLVE